MMVKIVFPRTDHAMDAFVDYYEILEISPAADLEEIKRSFRRLVRQYHPDVAGQQATDHFQRIHEAYRILSDPTSRRKFHKSWQVHRGAQSGQVYRAHTDPRVVITPQMDTLSPNQQKEQAQEIQLIRKLLRQRQWMAAVAKADTLVDKYVTPETIHILALTYQRLGSYYLMTGHYREAKDYLHQALETEPHNRELAFDIKRDLDLLQAQLEK